MEVDPFEQELDDNASTSQPAEVGDEQDLEDIIQTCETSNAWTAWRDQLAEEMFTSWMASRN